MNRLAAPLILLVLSAIPVSAQPVTSLRSQTAFRAAAAAVNVPIPDHSAFTMGSCGTPFGQTSIGTALTLPIDDWTVLTITANEQNRLCLFDEGAVIPSGNTLPNVMTGNTLVGDGEDDYLFTFTESISAIGLQLLTNYAALEAITFYDGDGAMIDEIALDAYTAPNTRMFLGSLSHTPFTSTLLETTGGDWQNEGIDLILVGTGHAARR